MGVLTRSRCGARVVETRCACGACGARAVRVRCAYAMRDARSVARIVVRHLLVALLDTRQEPLECVTSYRESLPQPMAFGKDIFLSNAGPAWIYNPMEYKESPDKSTMFVYAPCSHTPVDYPIASAAGYHYCKILSPARAMEWIYIDGLRAKAGVAGPQPSALLLR